VALARALVTDPRIVLFDEPTSGQDPVRKNAILSMVAQYHKKFGFTAVLVSHEIPDVFFISDRILALYQGSIVFQGSPEELEAFDHPFKDEVVRSLEGLEDELTGLYSRRHFKVQYHALLKQRTSDEAYSVIVFTLEPLEAITAVLGHEAAQEAIRNIALLIEHHFSAMGGFSTRSRFNELITALPYSDEGEAESLLKKFIEGFQEKGIRAVWPGASRQKPAAPCLELKIMAGIARGQLLVEAEAMIDLARSRSKEIIRLRCE
jgi:phospholipid/cholesterol/gamma-HCH transport system ATP-binding protein